VNGSRRKRTGKQETVKVIALNGSKAWGSHPCMREAAEVAVRIAAMSSRRSCNLVVVQLACMLAQ
jgi:hypothetical protein